MPPSRYRTAWNVSRKKPRGSRNTSGSTISTPGRSVSRNFKRSPLEPVPVPAHGEEVARFLRVHLQLDPQRPDEVVHRPRGALVLRSPAARKDVVAAQRPPVGGEEEPQHLELLGAHLDRRAVSRDGLPLQVDLHLTELDQLGLVGDRRPASEQRLDPREELAQPEGLAQVVVRAELEPEDLV